jgi:Leucine-rich repeat (LRR) protein
LDVLDVHHNRINDASPLTALENLRILNLSSNCISSLSDLSPLRRLAELNLRRNVLTSLHFLDCTGTSDNQDPAADQQSYGRENEALPPPGAPPGLQRLFVSHNRIALPEDIPVLRGLQSLRELALDSNPLADAGHEIVRLR